MSIRLDEEDGKNTIKIGLPVFFSDFRCCRVELASLIEIAVCKEITKLSWLFSSEIYRFEVADFSASRRHFGFRRLGHFFKDLTSVTLSLI